MEPQINQTRTAIRNLRSAAHVRKQLDISHITLWRRTRDPKLGFPQPIKINGRNFFHEGEIHEWVERQKGGESMPMGKVSPP